MRVLITGIAGSTGRLLAEGLAADPAITAITGLDVRAYRSPAAGVRFVRADLRHPEWTPLLREIDAAVHLAGAGWPSRQAGRTLDAQIVAGSKSFLREAAAVGVRKLIVLNSAAVYGPQYSGLIREDAPVRGHRAGGYARAWAQVSDYLDALEREWPGRVITRLRTAWITGPHHPALLRYLSGGGARACGFAHHWVQAIHEADLIAALRLAIREDFPDLPSPLDILAGAPELRVLA